MSLRRVVEHVREQNWTAIGIDLVIVVVATRLYWQQHLIREFTGPQTEARRILGLIEESLKEAR